MVLSGYSTNKTDLHYITEILMKVALNIINQTSNIVHLVVIIPLYFKLFNCF
jgi:hypothetical protein